MSITGIEANQKIAAALAAAQQEVQELETRLSVLTNNRTQVQLRRQQLLDELAQLRLKYSAEDGPNAQVTEQVKQLLAQRDIDHKTVLEKIAVVRRHLEQKTAALAALTDKQAEREQRFGKTEEAFFARLESVAEYIDLRKAAEEAERTLQHAMEKAEASNKERDEKAEDYLADPLFKYLWDRKFGTTEYSPGPLFGNLIHSLDQWVARITQYEQNRQNYSRLVTLPKWIVQHAEQASKDADSALTKLANYLEKHRAQSDLPQLQEQLEAGQAEVDGGEAELQQLEKELTELDAEDRAYSEGTDTVYQQAMDLLRHAFERKNLRQLEREAMLTPYPEDDAIIAKLYAVADELDAIQGERASLKDAVERGTKRAQQLSDVYRSYRQSALNRDSVTFPDGRSLDDTLHKVLTGLLTVEALSRYLQTKPRVPTPASPTRTPPGSPMRPMGSPTMPSAPPVRRSSPPIRSSGSFTRSSGGGFRTGGRVGGGGGFKTGGRF